MNNNIIRSINNCRNNYKKRITFLNKDQSNCMRKEYGEWLFNDSSRIKETWYIPDLTIRDYYQVFYRANNSAKRKLSTTQ